MDQEIDAIIEVLYTCSHILRRSALQEPAASNSFATAADELEQAIKTLETRDGVVSKD